MSCYSYLNKFLPALAALFFFLGCGDSNATPEPDKETDPQPETPAQVFSFTTSADKSKLFEETKISFDKKISVPGSISVSEIDINPEIRFQSIDGFGAAMTWASCYNLLQMAPNSRIELLKSLFGKEGLGISLIRVSIGASDFNLEEYTWCDDEGIGNFRVNPKDSEVVFPVLREIYAINPDVKIIASPWSCPKWMKQRSVSDKRAFDSWTSGSLRPDCYQDYAEYFVRWIQTMEKEGFKIAAVTLQNEPLNHGNSMSLYMGWAEQRDFIKAAIGPAFEKAGIKAKVLVFDHNYNYDNQSGQKNYPLKIFADSEASKFVAGSAWHNYGGDVSELDNIVRNAPDKEIYFTEASIGSWNYSFENCLINDFKSIFMQTLSRGCKGVTLWNMVLDSNNGPYSPADGSCKTCYGVLKMNASAGTIIDRTSHYYNIAHASKVIKAGAERIESKGRIAAGLDCQVYRNPDGSYGAIILNQSTAAQLLVLKSPKHSIETLVPARSINSLLWSE